MTTPNTVPTVSRRAAQSRAGHHAADRLHGNREIDAAVRPVRDVQRDGRPARAFQSLQRPALRFDAKCARAVARSAALRQAPRAGQRPSTRAASKLLRCACRPRGREPVDVRLASGGASTVEASPGIAVRPSPSCSSQGYSPGRDPRLCNVVRCFADERSRWSAVARPKRPHASARWPVNRPGNHPTPMPARAAHAS